MAIARPYQAKITLVTLGAEPEMYNQLAAPMLEDIRGVLQEETQTFLNELVAQAEYPLTRTVIATGELSEYILDICEKQQVDLVVCGNHNQNFFSRTTCSAKKIVSSTKVDVLLIPLGGL